MRVYEVVFDESQDAGVYALSCVNNPAMEDTWLALAEHPKEIQFATIDEEKRLLLGAALIPNKKIYRKDGEDEYYITFSEKTIEQCAHSFVKNGFVNNSSENHDVKLEGVSVVQSWIVENPEKDKSANYGKTYEKGTWVTMMKVENDETWEKAKDGTLNGFSIDGLFSLKEMDHSNNVNPYAMSKSTMVDAIREALGLSKTEKEAVKLGELTLKDGKTKVTFDGEQPEVGQPIFLKIETEGEDPSKEPMPEGKHELESGEFIHVDNNGLVSEEPVEVKEEEKEEVKEPEMVAELAKVIEEVKGLFLAKIEESKNELRKEFEAKFKAEEGKAKEVEAKLQAAEEKNKELEAKLQKQPAAEKIVKTELKVEQPRNAKQRLLNVALTALNKN